MILITGANGHLGSQTINHILEKNIDLQFAGLVRSHEKGKALKNKGVEIRIGDYSDVQSIEKAVKGVDKLLLISSSTMGNRIQQHRNVIETAASAGVSHIFYTSIVKADQLLSPLSSDHFETEKILKNSGINYTIFRHTFYTEFFPMFLGKALDTGQWTMPSNGQKINLAYRADMAEALANALIHSDNHKKRTYEITSEEAYTLAELTEIISQKSGKEIIYNDLQIDEFESMLQQIGLPDDQLGMALMTAEAIVNGALNHTSGDLKKLLQRSPDSLPGFIQELTT